MRVALGSDHAGFLYKEKVKALLISLRHKVMDCGTHSDAPVPYPQFIRPAALAVANGECERGIVFGGSGNGEAMVANKVKGVRCAYVWNSQTAELGRKHNDANRQSIRRHRRAPKRRDDPHHSDPTRHLHQQLKDRAHRQTHQPHHHLPIQMQVAPGDPHPATPGR